MQVIKDRSVINDDWSLIRDIEDSSPIPEGDVILPLAFWQANRDQLLKTKKIHAIWIDGSIETESLLDDIEFFSVIALDFPTFKDGRSYSHARLLRERYNYKGEYEQSVMFYKINYSLWKDVASIALKFVMIKI